MADGYLRPQGKFEHQVVIFTFAGQLPQANVNAWNAAIRDLKIRFEGHVIAATLKGERTPPKLRPKRRK